MVDPTIESLIRATALGLHFDEMEAPFKRNATLEDLDSVPENERGQLVDGDLWSFARAAPPHALALGAIHAALHPLNRDRSPTGWVILADVDVRFGSNVLVPDIAGWRRSRMPVVPDGPMIELAPDWVCEVFSPSTQWLDKGRKREIYTQGGVGHLWWVDPERHYIDVLTLDGASYRMSDYGGVDQVRRFAPFESIEMQVAMWWRR